MRVECGDQHRADGGRQPFGQRREPLRDVLLGVTGLQKRLDESGDDRRRQARASLAEHASDLGDHLFLEAGLEERLGRVRRHQVLLGEHPIVGARVG